MPALRLSGVSKDFGVTRALRNVSLEMRAGEIRGLVGRNGSGKSTLIKILSGYHEPDPGAELHVAGRPVGFPLPSAGARHLGLAFVHQDLGLLPSRSVLENLRVGRFATTFGGRIAWPRERAGARGALTRFGVDIDIDKPVSALQEFEKAVVAIVRGLLDLDESGTGGVLILDEATAYLPRDGVNRLFSVVRSVAEQGTAVLFVSHRLDEVLDVTETVSVLRDGEMVGTIETATTSEDRLIEMILGTKLDDYYPQTTQGTDDRALSVVSMSGATVTEVSFSLHRGEVLGVTGIGGSGYEEIPYLLFGGGGTGRGKMHTAEGAPIDLSSLTPALAMRRGLALLPADRQIAGGVPGLSVTYNLSLPVLHRFWRGGRLHKRDEQETILRLMNDHGIQPADPLARLSQLSGGNQQKALLAKWLQLTPPILLLHEPTQGVDVGAKKEIFLRLEAAARDGAAIVIASAEHEDLANICKRVLVFQQGRVVAALAGDELTEGRILERCYRPSTSWVANGGIAEAGA